MKVIDVQNWNRKTQYENFKAGVFHPHCNRGREYGILTELQISVYRGVSNEADET